MEKDKHYSMTGIFLLAVITLLTIVITILQPVPISAADSSSASLISKAYLSVQDGSKVSVIDLLSNSEIKTIDIFSPSQSCLSETTLINDIKILGCKAFLSVPGARLSQCAVNQVKVIDVASDTLLTTINTDQEPAGLKEYNGKLYLLSRAANKIQEIDPAAEAIVRTISFSNPNPGVITNPVFLEIIANKIYLPFPGNGTTAGGVQVLDLSSGNQITFVNFGTVDLSGPISIKQVGQNKIYLGGRLKVAVLDTSTNTLVKSFQVKNETAGYVMAFAIASNKVYTANSESTVSVIDLSTDTMVKQIDVGIHAGTPHFLTDIMALGDKVYVTDPGGSTSTQPGIKIIDTATDTVVNNISSSKLFGAIDIMTVQPPVAYEDPLPDLEAECEITLTPPTAIDHCGLTITASTDDPLTYTTKGTYTVTWNYQDDFGYIGTQTQTVTITGTCSSQTDTSVWKAYVTNQKGTKVSVIDLTKKTITKTITLYSPSSTCAAETGLLNDIKVIGCKVFVAVPGSGASGCGINKIKIIDTTSDTIVNTIDTEQSPTSFKEYNNKLYVLNRYGNSIQEIDPSSGAITRKISFSNPNPSYMKNPICLEIVNNKIYLPFAGSGSYAGGVMILNLSNGNSIAFRSFESVDLYGPIGIKQINQDEIFLGGHSNIAILDLSTDSIVGKFQVKEDSNGHVVAFAVATNKVYTANSDSTVSAIDFSAQKVKQIDVGFHSQLSHLLVDIMAIGDKIYVTDPGDGLDTPSDIKIIDVTTDTVVGNIQSSELLGAIDIYKVLPPVPDLDPLPSMKENKPLVLTPPTATDNCGYTIIATTDQPLSYNSPGTYTVTWSYEDAAGYTTTQTQSILIVDTNAPALTCPDPITKIAQASTTKVFYEATAVDNFDPEVVITYSPASGSEFPVGSTTVTVKAKDSSNNSSQCFFTVTVKKPSIVNLFPGDSIQQAINAALPGDTIVLNKGVYRENINFHGKGITLKSPNPNDPNDIARVIIDGNQRDSVISFENGEGSDSVLNGITVRNGSAIAGGGIYCQSSSPTIINCTVAGNQSLNGQGGGIMCNAYSSPTIENCIITGNYAGDDGGGIFCFDHSSPTIAKCDLTNNSSGGDGGGICCRSFSKPTIVNCIIAHNQTLNNQAGGGIYSSNYSLPSVTNCTIVSNSAGRGGGIDCFASSSAVTVLNSIFWQNIPSDLYGSPVVTYSMVKGGYSGTGNIDVNPRFVNLESGDYRLRSTSLCIDAGTANGAPATDREGSPRPRGAKYDLGAYEFVCHLQNFYRDEDNDHYGNPEIVSIACDEPEGYASNNLDCNDHDPNINPSSIEICDGQDNNCNDEIDEGISIPLYYLDLDQDGYGDANHLVRACICPKGYVDNFKDCNDTAAEIHPGAVEIYDGEDNNCDGLTDSIITPIRYTYSTTMQAGWNNVTLKLHPSSFQNAEEMAAEINQQGGSCLEIDQWVNGNWEGYVVGFPFNNYQVQGGESFFVKCTKPSTFNITGSLVIPE